MEQFRSKIRHRSYPLTTANEDANCSSGGELENVYGGVGYNFLDFWTQSSKHAIYTTNAWSNFDRRFDTVSTHLRQQVRTQIVALVESFDMYMVALDTTFWISRHRALNMP